MRLAEHLTALRAWCKQCLPGLTQHAPSRHSRDARVYGHMTTAMHEMRTPPSSSTPPGTTPACLVGENPTGSSQDTRVYGHTTTAMHKLSTPPPALPLSLVLGKRLAAPKKNLFELVYFCRKDDAGGTLISEDECGMESVCLDVSTDPDTSTVTYQVCDL